MPQNKDVAHGQLLHPENQLTAVPVSQDGTDPYLCSLCLLNPEETETATWEGLGSGEENPSTVTARERKQTQKQPSSLFLTSFLDQNLAQSEGRSGLRNLTMLKWLVAQSCPALCDPIDHSPQATLSKGILQARITGVGCQALLQGLFPAQGSNPGLQHCRWILYHLSHGGSPVIKQ